MTGCTTSAAAVACYAAPMPAPSESRAPTASDPGSAEAISWLVLGLMAAAIVIGLFLLLRTG